MNRLLYFTGFRMVAQEWSGSDLKNSVYFEPDEQGFELFANYLQSINQEPIRLLVDLIEEEFRQATIPFVRGPDRKELLKRNLDKFFRQSEFRHVISQHVETVGKRKEEQLLFTGLTNPELMEPWLDIIEQTKTPLAGIVSLPIISERFIKQFENKNKCTILVSQQVPSNLRQTVFVDGKIILSRLVPIASFYQGKYAEDVLRDIDSTQRYLVSQRLIERADTVSVHILSNSRHIDKLTVACAEASYFDYEIHNINELLKKQKIELYEEQDFSSILFCYEATKLRKLNHYARSKDQKYLKHYFIGLGLKIAGIATFAIGLGLGASNVIEGMLFQNQEPEMQSLKLQYDKQFDRLVKKTKSLPAPTQNMKKAVDLAGKIEKDHIVSPKEFIYQVSQDLQLFADLRATDIQWFVSDSDTVEQAKDVIWDNKKRSKLRRLKRGQKRKKPIKGHYEIMNLSGKFVDFNGNYRYALSVLSDFENLLKESGKYDQVYVLKRPLNVDDNVALSGKAVETKNSTLQKEALFRIKLIKKVPFNA